MVKYRKKPIVVDVEGPLIEAKMVITAHGRIKAKAGDFIITDPNTGDTWPIKPDLFEGTYELVDEIVEEE